MKRRGRWVYDSESSLCGVAGWHLDGSPLVIDFMPGMTDFAPSRGMYLLYNWPGREHEMISPWFVNAMMAVEGDWDALTDDAREVIRLDFAANGPDS